MASERPSGERRYPAWNAGAYALVSGALAIALLVAADLKAQALITESAARSSPEHWSEAARWVAIAAECLVAGWLLSGIDKVWARRTALVLLSVFLCVAGWHLLVGDKDCGCFGTFAMHPARTAALDGVALILIVWFGRALPLPKVGRTGLALGPRPAPARALVALAVAMSAIAIVFSLGFGHVRPEPYSASGLVCEQPTYSFGEVDATRAAVLQHEFVLRNVGSRPVRILRHIASCGCTSAAPRSATVAPGDSMTVPVKVDWRDRDGEQAATVTLATDRPDAPTVVLKVAAVVATPITVWPRVLDFGELPPGPSQEREFGVSQRRGQATLHITDIRATGPTIRIRRLGPGSNMPLAGGPGRFGVQLISPRQPETREERILVCTTESGSPTAIIVRARASGAIRVTPGSLLFDLRRSASPQVAEVRVAAGDPRDASRKLHAEVTATCGVSPFRVVKIAFAPAEGGASATVIVRCERPSREILAGSLRIVAGEDELKVPVIALGPSP